MASGHVVLNSFVAANGECPTGRLRSLERRRLCQNVTDMMVMMMMMMMIDEDDDDEDDDDDYFGEFYCFDVDCFSF